MVVARNQARQAWHQPRRQNKSNTNMHEEHDAACEPPAQGNPTCAIQNCGYRVQLGW
jgi:hypothetical protein